MDHSDQKVVVTGVKPTGAPHLGNFAGAIRPALALSRVSGAGNSFMFIADYHALNQVHDAKTLHHHTLTVASTFLALGLDVNRTTFYRQSDVAETLELSTILCSVTPKGFMNRAHAYKAEVDKNAALGRKDLDIGINMGLFTYPILMAADILQFDADLVPVGKDQAQHIEFSRDIAGHFNEAYGGVLKLPSQFVQPDSAIIPGLDGRKMSKSYNNTIPLFADEKALQKLIMKIVTDSKGPTEPKDPELSTVFNLYSQFANDQQIECMRHAFTAGEIGYGDAKRALFEVANAFLQEPRERFCELMNSPRQIAEILGAGAHTARTKARSTLTRVKEAIGVGAMFSEVPARERVPA